MRKIFSPLLVLLAASLVLAGSAHAVVIDAGVPGVPTVNLPEETELIGAEEEDEWEEVDGEWDDEDEWEDDEWEEWEAGEEPPVECLLRSASAKATVPAKQDRLLLTISYSTYERTEATIDYRLRGAKGSLHLPQARQRLGERGVLHVTEPLSESEAERARAAKDFTVQIRIAGTPSECRSISIRRLTIKRSAHNQLTWRQSGSIFGGDA
jgi:hypothetical protein